MVRRPPRSTRTDTLCPYTTLFPSCENDLELAFAAAYDAARKSLTAVLAIQGLRPTSAGGHLSVYYSSLAQFEPPMGRKIKPFDWMRRTRNDTEYPHAGSAELDVDRSEERRVGKDGGSTCRSRRSPYP